MRQEIEKAASFWASKLDPSLGYYSISAFEKEVVLLLADKFSSHWYENEPQRGQAYREVCCDYLGHTVDDVLLIAANNANFQFFDYYYPHQRGLRMWIDPGEVEVCYTTPPYQNCVIYNANNVNNDIKSTNYKTTVNTYNNTTYYNTYDSDQYYLAQGKISPPIPSNLPYAHYSSKPVNSTVASNQHQNVPHTIKTK